jgi:hypothetical protein
MNANKIDWPVLAPNVETVLTDDPQPIRSLARGDAAAVVIRQAFSKENCRSLTQQLIDEELMFAADDSRIGEKALTNDVVGKYLGRSLNPDGGPRRRIDIGASMGNFGENRDEFFQLSKETHTLFNRLFASSPNPVASIYDTLQKLTPDKRVLTAEEPDGQQYGPAIFRVHYGGFTYGPHFDSVRNRESRTNYVVHKYQSQLAGVLCLQNTTLNGQTAQGIVHRQFWTPEIDPFLKTNSFHDYAHEENVPNIRVELEPGDLYFFNTGLIHEVPGVPGDLPRVVLATFIGYSEDEPDVMVWS